MITIPYGRHEVAEVDVQAVAAALRDPLITQGPKVAAFEATVAETVGARYAVAFSSGTAALHAAYAAAGIAPGRTVLTSPITFVATANAALYLGGGVRFADIDSATVLLDPDAVARAAARDIHVLSPVHFGGQVADLEALGAIARREGWTVVEDAAHAMGAVYRTLDGTEHRVGDCSFSHMACFSFHPVKHITTGEGGAVTTNDPKLYRALQRFRTHGITREADELIGCDGPWYYEQHDLGFNYRITDFQCALGLSQLARLGDFVVRRRAIAARYDRAFEAMPGVRRLAVPEWSRGSYHLYVVRVARQIRREVFDGLREAGLGVNVHYIPVYRHPYYRSHGFAETKLANAEDYYAEAITLPMYPGLSDDDIETVISELERHTAVHSR